MDIYLVECRDGRHKKFPLRKDWGTLWTRGKAGEDYDEMLVKECRRMGSLGCVLDPHQIEGSPIYAMYDPEMQAIISREIAGYKGESGQDAYLAKKIEEAEALRTIREEAGWTAEDFERGYADRSIEDVVKDGSAKMAKGAGGLILLVFGIIVAAWLLLMGNIRK